jgi:chitinase
MSASLIPYPCQYENPNGTVDAAVVTLANDDDGGKTSGQIQFRSLVQQGALQLIDGRYLGSGGFERSWDECSSTVSHGLITHHRL